MNQKWYKEFLIEEQKEIDIMKEYGMDEGKIQEIVERDYKDFCIEKKEKRRQCNLPTSIDDTDQMENAMLYEKFPEQTTVEQSSKDHFRSNFWIEEIENKELYNGLKRLNAKELEILIQYALEGKTMREIAKEEKTTPTTIARKMKKIRTKFMQ